MMTMSTNIILFSLIVLLHCIFFSGLVTIHLLYEVYLIKYVTTQIKYDERVEYK